jgi:micrococcal nuclease
LRRTEPWSTASRLSRKKKERVTSSVVDAVLVEGALHLSFAKDWRHGFSRRLGDETRRLFRDAGNDPRRLVGTRVRVRSFIQGRQRPTIDVTHPEQVERLDP